MVGIFNQCKMRHGEVIKILKVAPMQKFPFANSLGSPDSHSLLLIGDIVDKTHTFPPKLRTLFMQAV